MATIGFAVFLTACQPERPSSSPDATPSEATDPASAIGRYEGSHALLVAVGDYELDEVWPDLDHDLDPLEATLSDLGFEVETVLDPDGYSLRRAFDEFIEDHGAEAGNRLLFFFAGHAHSEGHKAYLVPADSLVPDDGEFHRRVLPLADIRAAAESMAAEHALFLFDSSLADTTLSGQGFPKPRPPDAETTRRAHQLIAADNANRRMTTSPFVPLVVQALEGEADTEPDEWVTGTELADWIVRQAPETDQPIFTVLGASGSGGDVVFSLSRSSGQDLLEMEERFAEIRDDEQLSAVEKIAAWKEFLTTYPEIDSPVDGADELRRQATVWQQFWEREQEALQERLALEQKTQREDQARLAREKEERELAAEQQRVREAAARLEREKAEREADELRERERQARLEREKAEREADELREREAQAQLEREAEDRLARERADREARQQREREVAERLERERADREARQQREREVAERLERERADREAQKQREREVAERLERERADREARQRRDREERKSEEREREERERDAQTPGDEAPGTGIFSASSDRQLVRAPGSALLLKVVGLSDNIAIYQTPPSDSDMYPDAEPADGGDGGARKIALMEPLKSYFVLEEVGDSYRIASKQGEGGIEGFVFRDQVTAWNTREGLHFIPKEVEKRRRKTVDAWSTLEAIETFAVSLDPGAHPPDLSEELQTRVGPEGAIPYPLLGTKKIQGKDGVKTIYKVLIPVTVPVSIETDLSPGKVKEVVGAVTVCVVFDASRSMRPYARNFAATLEEMLSEFSSETRIAIGYILFREPGRDGTPRFEMRHPMGVDQAVPWLRERVRDTFDGKDANEPEPVLDAMTLAEVSFLWNNRPAIRGANRIAILVANEDAMTTTLGASANVPAGRSLEDVAWNLLQNRIRVFSLQAGPEDHGNLVEVLRTLATETGGEFYRSAVQREEIRDQFNGELRSVLRQSINDGVAAAGSLALADREDGGTVIALDAMTEAMRQRLLEDARRFEVSDGGLVIHEAWVFEQPGLYREEILIDKEMLKDLVAFFNHLSESNFTARDFEESTASLLEALIGEDLVGETLEQGVDIQEMVEKALGTHFETNLLSFELEHLQALSAEERALLQDNIRAATGGLAEFLEFNLRRFEQESRIWMPVSYLP